MQGGAAPEINFVPMRGDFARGILASVYTDCDLRQEEAEALYRDFYADCGLHLRGRSTDRPQTGGQHQQGGGAGSQVRRKLHIVSAIDNLLKGLRGQAVQNMNLLFGARRGARGCGSSERILTPGARARIQNRIPPAVGRVSQPAEGSHGEPPPPEAAARAAHGAACTMAGRTSPDDGLFERQSARETRGGGFGRRTVLWRACCGRLPKASSSAAAEHPTAAQMRGG